MCMRTVTLTHPHRHLLSQGSDGQNQTYLLVGSDHTRGQNQGVLLGRLREEHGIECALKFSASNKGVIVCSVGDLQNGEYLKYNAKMGDAANIIYLSSLLKTLNDRRASGTFGSGGGSGGGVTPASASRGSGGHGAQPWSGGMFNSPPPRYGGAAAATTAPQGMGGHSRGGSGRGGVGGSGAPAKNPSCTPSPFRGGSGAIPSPAPGARRGSMGGHGGGCVDNSPQLAGWAISVPSSSIDPATRTTIEKTVCSAFIQAWHQCPICHAQLVRARLGADPENPTGHIVRGCLKQGSGLVSANKRCCGYLRTDFVMQWVMQNCGPWSQ